VPAVTAQGTSPSATQVAAMKRFDLFVGEWRGAGWSTAATGKRVEFNLVETVARKTDGTVLLIEGRGTGKDRDGTETVTHDGLSLLYYDEKTGRYRWNGHEVSSGTVDAEAKPLDGGLEWTLHTDARGAAVRFTIKFDEVQWHEVGEASADGRTWSKFMEMTLARVSPKGTD
jgi:hypothetical protein